MNCTLIKNPRMIIVYLIGAWVGLHHFEWITARRSTKQAMICFIVYIACCFVSGIKHLLPQWMSVRPVLFIITMVSCVAFYVSFDYFAMKSCPDYMRNSFLIYAMHSLVGAALSKIIRMLLPSGDIFTLLTAIVSFVTTIVIICMFGGILRRYTPRLKRILVGR